MFRQILRVGALVALLPALAAGQNPTPTPPATPPVTVPTGRTPAQEAAAAAGRTVSNAEIADAIKNSGLTEAQVRARLQAAGFDTKLADPFFSATGGRGNTPRSADPGFVSALQSLGIVSVQQPIVVTAEQPTEDATAPIDSTAKERDTTSKAPRISVFGKSVFSGRTTAFDPVAAGPVDASYRLGVGDQLQYVVTGDMEMAAALEIRRDGTVVLPQVGQVAIAGLTLEGARTVLSARAGRVFSLIGSGKARIDLTVSRVRANQVFVIGEVEHPGAYQVSALGTVFRALSAAGGPTERGSFRDIEVRRGNAVVGRVDLYDYLIRGDASKDLRTEQGDIVFVPLSTRVVAVQGAVRRPGVFELRAGEGFSDLLRFAGGLLPTAATERILIDRVLPPEQRGPGRERAVLDVPFSSNPAVLDTVKVYANDIVRVFSVGDIRRNQVMLAGEVFQPGTFEWTPGMTLGGLIQKAQGYLPWALTDRVKVQRPVVNTGRTEIFNLDARDSTTSKFPLYEFDEVTVLDGRRAFPAGEVSITGAVYTPGKRPYVENITLGDLIDVANGLQLWAVRQEIKVLRTDPATGKQTQLSFDLREPNSLRFRLERGDSVVVLDARKAELSATVRASGSVFSPGTFPFAENRTVRDLITLSGGLKPEAATVELARRRVGAQYSDTSSIIQVFSVLPDGHLSDGGDAVVLSRGDVVDVRDNPGMRTTLQSVTLNGLFTYPGTYVLKRDGERLSEVVQRAGGVLPSAYLGSGRLERLGRPVAIDLARALRGDVTNDLPLRPGDRIFLASDPSVVYVAGAVERQVVVPFKRGWKTLDYIDAAGGFSLQADEGNIVIEFPSGETHRRRKRLGMTVGDVSLVSGSTITVGQKSDAKGTDVGEVLTKTMQITATLVSIFLTYKVATK